MIIFYLLILFLFPSIKVQAAGLQLQPTSFNIEVHDQAVQTKLVVSNPAKEIQLFEIYADDLVDFIDIDPKIFTLESGTRKEILITIKPNKEASITNTNLSITSRPFAIENFAINSAAKIPITIKQLDQKTKAQAAPLPINYILIAIILGLILYISWFNYKQRKRPNS